MTGVATPAELERFRDEQAVSPCHSYLLTEFEHPEYPVPLGVFRSLERPTYEERLGFLREKAAGRGPDTCEGILEGFRP